MYPVRLQRENERQTKKSKYDKKARRRILGFRQPPAEGMLLYCKIPYYTVRLEGGLAKKKVKKISLFFLVVVVVEGANCFY